MTMSAHVSTTADELKWSNGAAKRVTKNMLEPSVKAIAHQADPTTPGAGLLPELTNVRAASAAVYHAAVDDDVAAKKHDNVVQAILDTMWVPDYTKDAR